jgi:hypothetical protein
MNSEDYVHPEFGWLAPKPRLRRELRIAFLSMVVGFSIGAITVIGMVAAAHNADTATPLAAHEAAAPSVSAAAVPNGTAGHSVSPSHAPLGQARSASAGEQRTADSPHAANKGPTSTGVQLNGANQQFRGVLESTIEAPAAASPGPAVPLDPSQTVPTKRCGVLTGMQLKVRASYLVGRAMSARIRLGGLAHMHGRDLQAVAAFGTGLRKLHSSGVGRP